MRNLGWILVALLAGCPGTEVPEPAGRPDASARDASTIDATAALDAAPALDGTSGLDATPEPDATSPDASVADATIPDAGSSPVGLFVDPQSGANANAGTRAAPFRTLRHAASMARAGEVIVLLDGSYGADEAWNVLGIDIPAGVGVRADHPGLARLSGTAGNQCALTVHGSTLDGLDLTGFEIGIRFQSGESTGTNLRVTDTSIGFFVVGTSTVTLVGPEVSAYRSSAFGVAVALIDDTGELTLRGGTYEGARPGTAMILARGRGKLVAEGTTFRNNSRSAVRAYDSGELTLRDVLIEASAPNQLDLESASIYIGPSNTMPALGQSLRMERTRILRSPGNGVSVTFYNGVDSRLRVAMIDSEISDTRGRGVLVDGAGITNPGLELAIEIRNSTIARSGSTQFGIAALDLVNSAIDTVIEIGNTAHAASIRARGSAIAGVRINASTTVTCDLGTAANRGNNTFSPAAAPATAVRIDAPQSCTAIGNTWVPSEQGADAAGHYSGSNTVMGPAMGRNYTLITGASITL